MTPARMHATTVALTESLAPVALERTYDSRGMKPKKTNDANVTRPFFRRVVLVRGHQPELLTIMMW